MTQWELFAQSVPPFKDQQEERRWGGGAPLREGTFFVAYGPGAHAYCSYFGGIKGFPNKYEIPVDIKYSQPQLM